MIDIIHTEKGIIVILVHVDIQTKDHDSAWRSGKIVKVVHGPGRKFAGLIYLRSRP
jgi:hypothetical protein